jgi:hypothetical protein
VLVTPDGASALEAAFTSAFSGLAPATRARHLSALRSALVRAENLCHLGICATARRRLGPACGAGRAGAGLVGGAMIFGLWA